MNLTIKCTEDVGNKIAAYISNNDLEAIIVVDDRYLVIENEKK